MTKYSGAFPCSAASSVCSVAPSLSELDDELAQYADLLGDATKPKLLDDDDCSQNIQLESECMDDPIPMDIVKQLDSILMPPPGSSTNSDYALRPTAASLGLKESIEECLREAEYPTGSLYCLMISLLNCMQSIYRKKPNF